MYKEFQVVTLARQIVAMQDIIDAQDEELVKLRAVKKDYDELLRSSVQHSEKMAFGLLKLATHPGVAEALSK